MIRVFPIPGPFRCDLREGGTAARNRKEFEEIPEDARKALEFLWIERIDEAANAALCDKDRKTPQAA